MTVVIDLTPVRDGTGHVRLLRGQPAVFGYRPVTIDVDATLVAVPGLVTGLKSRESAWDQHRGST